MPRVDDQEWIDRLREALRRGETLVLAGDQPPDGHGGSPWSHTRRIPAGVIRQVLLHPPEDADPRGLTITGALIQGRLDLQYATISVPVTLRGCVLPDGIAAEGCHLTQLTLTRSRITTLDLNKAHIGADLVLDHVTINAGAPRLPTGLSGPPAGTSPATGAAPGGAINLIGAHIGGLLKMDGANLTNTGGPALNAGGATINQSVFRERFTATSTGPDGTIHLAGARIRGLLEMDGANLTNTGGPALNAGGATIDQSVFLRKEFTATSTGPDGTIHLLGARIRGLLEMDGANLTNTGGPALNAGGATIDQSVFLRERFTATSTGPDGTIHLAGARIRGLLVMDGASLTNTGGPALRANGATIDQSVFLGEGFTATGTGPDGTLCLFGTRVGGELDLRGCELGNSSGPALASRALQVGGNLSAGPTFVEEGQERQRLVACGCGRGGVVQLAQARIEGRLVLSRAHIILSTPRVAGEQFVGPGLNAPDLTVKGSLLLAGCDVTGSGPDGAIRLRGAHIGGGLNLRKGTVTNISGPGLNAPDLTVKGSLRLAECDVTGSGPYGAIRLRGAHIDGALNLRKSTVTNDRGPVLSATRARIGRGLLLDGAKLTGHAPPPGEHKGTTGEHKGTIRLIGTTVGGNLVLSPDLITAATGPDGTGQATAQSDETRQLWAVEDFTYTNIPTGPPGKPLRSDQWLKLLRRGTTGYSAQPYRHLAAATTAAGHDDETRTILITQRQHQIAEGHLSRRSRAWVKFTGLTLKYGYQPWRALLWATAITIVSVVLAVTIGGAGGLIRPQPPASNAASQQDLACDSAERISYALDGFLPVVRTGARQTCTPAHNAQGTLIRLGGWLLGVTTWAFLTLFVAGFTNAIRKT